MKKINLLLRKCKSLSRQLARSSSYSNLRSKSTREEFWTVDHDRNNEDQKNSTTIIVGSSKKRYVVSPKYLNHPLFEALLDKSSDFTSNHGVVRDRDDHDHDQDQDHDHRDRVLVVKCEVVLFDHLLWMLENADPITLGNNSESLEELAALYVF